MSFLTRSAASAARAALLVAALCLSAAAGNLVVTFLDCGQGDAAFLELPNGKTALIDAGPREEWTGFDAGRDVLDPFLKKRGVKNVDFAVLSHAHLDHLGGFRHLLDHYPVGTFYDPGASHASLEYKDLLKRLLEKNVSYQVVRRGDDLPWDPDLEVAVLAPPRDLFEGNNLNDNSLVLRVRHGKVVFLFTGDAERTAEAFLTAEEGAALKCAVLKSAHHGSKTSSSAAFLEAARPRAVVVSAGRGNRYGHPHPVVLERYKARRIRALRTDTQGHIRVVSNGRRWRVKAAGLKKAAAPAGPAANP
jgi:competence protein ComEC